MLWPRLVSFLDRPLDRRVFLRLAGSAAAAAAVAPLVSKAAAQSAAPAVKRAAPAVFVPRGLAQYGRTRGRYPVAKGSFRLS